MDLRKYYLENVELQEYYHNFYELIKHTIFLLDMRKHMITNF